MSNPPPRLLLLASSLRRAALEPRLRREAADVATTMATPETAPDAVADGPFDVVVLAPNRPPTPQWVLDLARACAPASTVLVLPPGSEPFGEADGIAACLVGDEHVVETVYGLLRPSGGASALHAALARVAEPLVLTSSDGRVVAANVPFTTLTGWSDTALLGSPLDALLPPEVAARVAIDAATSGHEWSARALPLHARDDRPPVTVDVRASVVRLAAGRATWLLRFTPSQAPRVPASPEAAAAAIDDLTRRVRSAGTKVGGAHVRLIGLSRARQVLGDQWPRFQQHISLVCESTIHHELGPQDVAMATKTGDYLVCFACEDDEEADRRANRLQATIDRRLFGEEGGDLHRTRRGREALDALSVEVEAAVLPPDATVAPKDIAERFARECASRRLERLAEFNHHLEQLGAVGGLELLPMATPRGTLPTLVRAHWFPPDYARLQRMAERANRLDDLRLALDLRRLALVDTAEDEGVFEEASAIVDLHIGTIERRKSWDALLPVIQHLAGSTRRWLVPNLVGIPNDVYPGRLRDAMVTLKPFSRTQTMTLSARQLATLDLMKLPCRLFVITAGEAASALESDLPQRIRERAELARAKLAVDGGSESLAAAFGASLRTVRPEAPASTA